MRSRINHGGQNERDSEKIFFEIVTDRQNITVFKKISQHQVSDIRHLLRNFSFNILEPENLTCMSQVNDTILKRDSQNQEYLDSYSFILVKPDKKSISRFYRRELSRSFDLILSSTKETWSWAFFCPQKKVRENIEGARIYSGQIRT